MYDILQLNDMLVPELKELAEQLGLKGYKRLTKQELIYKILDHQAITENGSSSGDAEAEKSAKDAPEDSNNKPERKKRTRKRVKLD